MKRNYPLSFFLFGMVMNFLLRYFYLFIPGVVLCIIGIWKLPCLLIGLSVLGLDLLLSFLEQLETRKALLEDSDNEEYNELRDACLSTGSKGIMKLLEQKMQDADQEAEENDQRQAMLQKLTVYRQLNSAVHHNMSLDEIIDSFSRMCEISVGEPDDLLFETGTFNFTGEALFYFSLVRQFRIFDDTDEYVQLHLDVTYSPSFATKLLRKAYWRKPEKGDFFEIVKASTAYRAVKDLPYQNIEVYIEET